MRRAAIHTAASVKAANTTLLIRTMTIEAESNAGGEINACQAYAKRAPAASARICLFHESDRRADAPDNVQAEHVHRPWDGDAKRRYEAGAQQVLMRIIRIEERLSCQSLLHDAVGRGEYDDGGPAASPVAYHFSDQDSATAVQRNEQHQGRQRGQCHIAKQELRYQWCDHQQQQYGAIRDHQPRRSGPVVA